MDITITQQVVTGTLVGASVAAVVAGAPFVVAEVRQAWRDGESLEERWQLLREGAGGDLRSLGTKSAVLGAAAGAIAAQAGAPWWGSALAATATMVGWGAVTVVKGLVRGLF